VDAPGRLVERVPGLVGRDGVVVEGVLVLALQDVPEHRPGVAVREDPSAGFDRHLLNRHLGVLPVQLLDDVPPGELGHLGPALLVVPGQHHPADPDGAGGKRDEYPIHG